MKNRQILVALRKQIGNRKVMQRDVLEYSEDPITAKKGYEVVFVEEVGLYVVYQLPTLKTPKQAVQEK